MSSLYVAQIKDKCGIEKRLNYNVGDNKSRAPKCPPEKEKAIMAAFKHFNMIRDILPSLISFRMKFDKRF